MNSFAPLMFERTPGPTESVSITSGAERATTAGMSYCCEATISDAIPPMLAPTSATREGPFARR